MKYFSGVGSRETPPDICKQMTEIARFLEDKGYTLRSGLAIGADVSFSGGVYKNAQIWLPSPEYNREFRWKHANHDYRVIGDHDGEAYRSVSQFHPNPQAISPFAWKLMMRNYRILVGDGEPNSRFVICWTKDGKASGGSGQLMRIAESMKIPIYNMFHLSKEDILRSVKFLELVDA